MKGFSLKSYISLVLSFSLLFSEYLYALTLPSAVPNGVFHLDAQDVNGNGSTLDQPANGSDVSTWWDIFGSHSWTQTVVSQRPQYQTGVINGFPVLRFLWGTDILEMTDHTDINLDISYPEKSFAFLFRTRTDILSHQIIYEQSIGSKGYSLQVDNGNLYFWSWNTEFWTNPHEYKVVNLGSINSNSSYRVIISQGSTLTGHLNWVLAGSVTNVGVQTTHGQCIFDTSFGCALFVTGGTIGIGWVQNDTLRLSDLSTISSYQSNFFNGDIAEIISWNHTLTASEISGIDEYLRVHWGFDTTPPVITGINIASGTLIPKWDFTIVANFTDTGSSVISSSFTGRIYAWDASWATWDVVNLAPAYMSITGTTTVSTGMLQVSGLPFGKYRFDILLSDTAGNMLTQSYTYFIDGVEWTISSPSFDIGSAPLGADTYGSGELIITIRTLWAGFTLNHERTEDLTYLTGTISVYSGSTGWWYDRNIGSGYSGSISAHANPTTIVTVPKNINQNGQKNIFTYRVKYALNPWANDPAWDYIGRVRFGLNFNF